MPIAAVPDYLGKAFEQASPGMRFGFYLPIWTDRTDQENEVHDRAKKKSREGEDARDMLKQQGMDATISALQQRQPRPLPGLWDKNDFAARESWQRVASLGTDDSQRMAALAARQTALADGLVASGQLLTLDAKAVAPFTTGLGNEHPLENGFAFLNPYGLPYLPGSGVKGVLRQAARELARGDWGDTRGWTDDAIDALFGKEAQDGTDHQRGALSFWDVIPQIQGNRLLVEVMTAHQSHYYQHNASPHESGQPNPINFLTVPPGSGFTFHVVCNRPFLSRIAPELAEQDRWKSLLTEAFEHAFDWLGFGAKTAVGYGALEIDRSKQEAAERRQAEERAAREREAEAAAHREAEAEAARQRQAAFDALPESDRALHRFEHALAAITGSPPLNDNAFATLKGYVKELAEQATDWPDAADRARAADAIQAAFERFGWTPSGLKSKQRNKREEKNRELVAKLRR